MHDVQTASHVALCREGGGGVFSSRMARTTATKHEAAHAETEAVAEDGRCCMRARCVITEHLAGRSPQKPRVAVWSTARPHICLPGSTTGVPEAGRAIRGPDLRLSAGLNWHKIWSDCENDQVKGGFAGLKMLCRRRRAVTNVTARDGASWYLELRQRPICRGHARHQPPAGSRRHGGGAEEPAPVPVGVTGHRTQRSRGQIAPPGPRALDHAQQPAAQPRTQLLTPHWAGPAAGPGGERWPIWPMPPPLVPLIAQPAGLVRRWTRGCVGRRLCYC
jgi:hypothetical protein